ncbi:MAG: TlpA family protein disulfide reductase [Alistipes sp.]|nr:TlpA family protein disulfide reductase [Alistipes sp.]
MKYSNIILFCALALGLASCSKSQIRMSFEGFTNDTVVVFSLPVEMFTTATDDSALTIDTLLIRNNRIDIARPEKTMSYIFSFRETDENSPNFSRRSIYVIATPEDRLTFEVKRTEEQFEYTAKGSDYVEGVADYDSFMRPISHKIDQIDRSVEANWGEIRALYDARRAQAAEWLERNMDNPAAVYVLAYEVSSKALLDYYDELLPMINTSPLKPIVEQSKASAELAMVTKQAQELIKEGVEAPIFTLPENHGNSVSLGSFRGKWVVLDFWGTWCGYCIKGIPAMKAAYEKHKSKCEFISIDCNESREKWLAGVEKYQMPWVHLYNSDDVAPRENVSAIYAIQGYPTKIIITPEGIIHKIFVGENDDFYNELDRVL